MCGARWYVLSTVVCVEHGGMCGARWYVWSTVVCVEYGGMCGARWYVWSTVVCVEHGGMCGARWYAFWFHTSDQCLGWICQDSTPSKNCKILMWSTMICEPWEGLHILPFSTELLILSFSRPFFFSILKTKCKPRIPTEHAPMCGARWYAWWYVCGARWYVWSTVVCVEHGCMCGARLYVWSRCMCGAGMCTPRSPLLVAR